ncbi:myotubularin-related protein 9-like isoform X1 [Varroa destructor]|uniref:Myotubularin phosphatase domain-containing protein n=1 Tax=Varroa destructor TaxID=109461 RepID=A0A7M7KS83_VARDE|nr:myotubularin-related protein 9-like isoform X1 [Varroa destructor]XP_022669937.1 myotubularin-related protein 9-like isoform X1 [Varroa destructor]XP_022669938.1 myotubularin-related protein 9-like isoform X1 [Varroa destructor]XP_022669939.1 myotubularin-related protein 9-like isoform X1 [Varroa destructor]
MAFLFSDSAMELTDYIKVTRVDKVFLYESHQPRIEGTLVVSSYNLIFSQLVAPVPSPITEEHDCLKPNSNELSKGGGESSQPLVKPKEIWVLHRMIDVVEHRSNSTMLYLKCKDLRWLKLDIPGVDNCQAVVDSINVLKKLTGDEVRMCYPFYYRPLFKNHSQSPTREIPALPSKGRWRVSNLNKDFLICQSYPTTVVVPQDTTDEEIIESSQFREGGRFPVLAYSSSTTSAVLLRSGQPLVGPAGRRCRADENLLSNVISGDKKGLIIDLRSVKQMEAARAKGGGIEPETHYTLWKKINKRVELSSDAYVKFIDACCDETLSTDKWLSRVESSGWLSAVKDVMQNACLTAQCLHVDGVSVLVHGTLGINSTLAVSSLAQVILEPRLRTINGFQELIEREWLSAGHPFQSRYANGPFSSKGKDNAPTFILFLDCVFQLLYQFPCCFEFTDHFLILLISHVYASSMGTFLCNSSKERVQFKVNELTVSLWAFLDQEEERTPLLNPLYEPLDEVIWPSVAPQSIQLWNAFYLRKTYDNSHERLAEETVKQIVEEDRQATDTVKELQQELKRLQRLKDLRDLDL